MSSGGMQHVISGGSSEWGGVLKLQENALIFWGFAPDPAGEA